MLRVLNPIELIKAAVSRSVLLGVVLILAVSLSVAPAGAKATTFTSSVSIPTELFVFVPCAVGGEGEFVYLSGPLHVLFVTTIDDDGGYHSKFLYQPQGISGTGLTTGVIYQGTGETQGTFNGKLGSEAAFVNNFKIIGQGPGNNYLVHETLHITVQANGVLTAYIDNISIECR